MEPPRKLIERVFDFCLTLVVAAFLLRLAVSYVLEVWPYLAIIAAIILIIGIAYRVWKYKKDNMGKW